MVAINRGGEGTMTFVRILGTVGLAALLSAGTLAGARAQMPMDPIETRQAGQDLLAGDFGGIQAVVALKGDVTKLENPAKAMARWIRQFPSQFPKGSETGHGTKALPAIWTDFAGFTKVAEDFAVASDKLAELAKAGDAAALPAQIKVVGDACGACHRTYRQR
jgi:cytochrome c556